MANDDYQNLSGFKVGIEKKSSDRLLYGITYTQRGYGSVNYYEGSTISGKAHLNYITGYLLSPANILKNLDFLLGMELGYLLNIKLENCYGDECESRNMDSSEWSDIDGNTIDYGLLIGGRVPLNNNIYINATYYYGLADLSSIMAIKNRSYQIYLSYGL